MVLSSGARVDGVAGASLRREHRTGCSDGSRSGAKQVRSACDPPDSFGARDTLEIGGRSLEVFRLDALPAELDVGRLPYSLKILLENLLRGEDGQAVTGEHIRALAAWDPTAESTRRSRSRRAGC